MEMILVEIKNDICTLTINRPEQYNALNIENVFAFVFCLEYCL